jgi:hypothetical protein
MGLGYFARAAAIVLAVSAAAAAETEIFRIGEAGRILAGESEIPVPAFEAAESPVSASFWRRARKKRRAVFKITTSRTNVCSDGVYEKSDIRRWQRYQRARGYNTVFRDSTRQGNTATGPLNAFRFHYVVVPRNRRDLLYKRVKVCVLATGRCAWGEAREIGPRFGELSIKGMMELNLNAHPQYGRYNGRVSYEFYD